MCLYKLDNEIIDLIIDTENNPNGYKSAILYEKQREFSYLNKFDDTNTEVGTTKSNKKGYCLLQYFKILWTRRFSINNHK